MFEAGGTAQEGFRAAHGIARVAAGGYCFLVAINDLGYKDAASSRSLWFKFQIVDKKNQLARLAQVLMREPISFGQYDCHQ